MSVPQTPIVPRTLALGNVDWEIIERAQEERQGEWKDPVSLQIRMHDAMRAVCIGFCPDTVSVGEMRSELRVSFTTDELDGPSGLDDGLTCFESAWRAITQEIAAATAPKP